MLSNNRWRSISFVKLKLAVGGVEGLNTEKVYSIKVTGFPKPHAI